MFSVFSGPLPSQGIRPELVRSPSESQRLAAQALAQWEAGGQKFLEI